MNRSVAVSTLKGFLWGLVVSSPLAISIMQDTLAEATDYRLMVSPTFTPQQQEAIRRAATNWEDAIGDQRYLTIHLQIGECPQQDGIAEACLVPSSHFIDCRPASAEAAGCTDNKPFYRLVQITTACGDINTFYHLAAHEIGHVLALPDTDVKHTLMYRFAACDHIQTEAAQDITQVDVKDYMLGR